MEQNIKPMWFCKWFKKEEIVDDPMKYLIVGLGNMGAEYDNTRHNIGFEVVDHLSKSSDKGWKNDTLGDISKIKHKGRTLVLLKPSTYMNRSGKSVNYWMQKEKIPAERILIIVDDLNLDFGRVRLRGKGSDGGHNGLRDINQIIGSNYARIRIGIGDNFGKGRQVNYVLGKWSSAEREELNPIIDHCAKAALSFSAIGIQHTMNKFNK